METPTLPDELLGRASELLKERGYQGDDPQGFFARLDPSLQDSFLADLTQPPLPTESSAQPVGDVHNSLQDQINVLSHNLKEVMVTNAVLQEQIDNLKKFVGCD